MIDVSQIIEQQKLGKFLLGLVTVSWLITFFDGLDANLISFAAPYFRSDYHLSTTQTGQIFGMHQLGTLIGGFILAYVADRVGRRPTIILGDGRVPASSPSVFISPYSYWSLLTLRFRSTASRWAECCRLAWAPSILNTHPSDTAPPS